VPQTEEKALHLHFLKFLLVSRTNGTLAFAPSNKELFSKSQRAVFCQLTFKDNKTCNAKFDLNLPHIFIDI